MWKIEQSYYTNEVNNNNFETNDFDELRDFIIEEFSTITTKQKDEIYEDLDIIEYMKIGDIEYFYNENGDEILKVTRL